MDSFTSSAQLYQALGVALGLFGLTLSAKASTSIKSGSDSTGIILSAGIDGGFFYGSFKKTNRWNLGGSAQADIPVATDFYFTANAGYLNFFGRNDVAQ